MIGFLNMKPMVYVTPMMGPDATVQHRCVPPYLLRSAAGVSRAESACCEAHNTEVENSYIIMSLPTASKGVHFRPYRPRDE